MPTPLGMSKAVGLRAVDAAGAPVETSVRGPFFELRRARSEAQVMPVFPEPEDWS